MWQDILIYTIGALVAIYLIYKIVKWIRRKPGDESGCGCSGCSSCPTNNNNKKKD
ncbi:FeoB-associated Cys-rich membrane protein [Falsiporphyromonas endometrii]|uniref:FeoB-associated Cys-rich membrane protein n=1 Tax=Falsiporphyromonas endometrii TaxID=1387297 RepID=A0ABV9K834_9PORP